MGDLQSQVTQQELDIDWIVSAGTDLIADVDDLQGSVSGLTGSVTFLQGQVGAQRRRRRPPGRRARPLRRLPAACS